jgi:hypothetical protein
MNRITVCALVAAAIATTARSSDVPFAPEDAITGSASAARSVAVADLDGDGDLDALSASAADNKVAWYENVSGNGATWTAHTLGTTAVTASSVTTADVEGDGDLDVLAASWSDDTVAWYENLGSGAFSGEKLVSTTADGAIAVAAADLDRDGDADVVTALSVANEVVWYENAAGNGSVWIVRSISTSITAASAVHAADLDGDGDLDVLSAAFGNNAVFWHENTGAGSFAVRSLVSGTASGALGVFASDVDGDGDLDVLSASSGNDQIAWHDNVAGDASSWVSRTISSAADFARSVFAADLDGDGDADVLSASSNDDEVAWYENLDGDGLSWTPRTITVSADQAYAVAAADVDGDGDPDVLAASSTDNTIAWHENRTIHRSAAYGPPASIDTTEPSPVSVAAGDLDRDGDLDLVVASFNLDRLSWYDNTAGDGSAWTAHHLSSPSDGARSVAIADIDRDGDVDLVCASTFDDEVSWYPNRLDEATNDFGPQRVIATTADEATGVFTADVDGDGDVDVLSSSAFDDEVAWYENTAGNGSTWVTRAITQDPDGAGGVQGFADKPSAVFATDLDGDGDVDALSASQDDDTIAWFENTGGASWTARTISTAADLAAAVWAADLDGDGDPDVLSASSLDHEAAWYENRLNEASNDFGPQQVLSSALDGARSIRAADLDLDGDLDVLGAGSSGFDVEVAWIENRLAEPAGGFGPKRTIATPAGSPNAIAADLDGDGDPDVAWTGVFLPSTHQISWNENRGGQFALATDDVAPPSAMDGESASLLRIVVTHLGRNGDTDAEQATIDLLLEESPGDPLSGGEADALLEELRIHHDDGSGVFEPGADVEVEAITSFPLAAGALTIALPDGDPELAVPFGSPQTHFVVVELAAGASMQSPSTLRITHRTESGSTAEDRDHDIPLSLEFVANASSSTFAAVPSVSGAVPDGSAVPGQVLTVDKVALGARIGLTWGASCLGSDTDYEVHEGTLGTYYSHVPILCSTSGATQVRLTPPAGSVYYLVVPRNATREGSYGTDSTGTPRPPSASSCRPQSTGMCP